MVLLMAWAEASASDSENEAAGYPFSNPWEGDALGCARPEALLTCRALTTTREYRLFAAEHTEILHAASPAGLRRRWRTSRGAADAAASARAQRSRSCYGTAPLLRRTSRRRGTSSAARRASSPPSAPRTPRSWLKLRRAVTCTSSDGWRSFPEKEAFELLSSRTSSLIQVRDVAGRKRRLSRHSLLPM